MQKRNEFRRLAISMVSLGLLVGAIFPFFMVFILNVPSDLAFRPLVFAMTIACGSGIGFANIYLTNIVVRSRLRGFNAAMLDLADGHDLEEIPCIDNADEFGNMGQSLIVFRDNAREKTKLEAEQAMAAERAEKDRREAVMALAENFEESIKGIVTTLSTASHEMESTAESMSSISDRVSSESVSATTATDQASANVQTVASAAEELSASISEIGRQVQMASEQASSAVSDSDQTNTKILGLAQAVQSISEVVDLISDIAEQTNLLALNATIEAARAGEAGKGFAVVANEVKNLANQTARATEDISTQISEIQAATNDAVGAIQGISNVIGSIDQVAGEIASAVEEQRAATHEIASSVQEAQAGTSQAASHVSQVHEAADEAGSVSHSVLDAARGLARQTENLSDDVDRFVNHVRDHS